MFACGGILHNPPSPIPAPFHQFNLISFSMGLGHQAPAVSMSIPRLFHSRSTSLKLLQTPVPPISSAPLVSQPSSISWADQASSWGG